MNPAKYNESFFKRGCGKKRRYETSAPASEAAITASHYVFFNRRNKKAATVIYKGGGTNGTTWAKQFVKELQVLGIQCSILKHNAHTAKCHITFRGVRAAAK